MWATLFLMLVVTSVAFGATKVPLSRKLCYNNGAECKLDAKKKHHIHDTKLTLYSKLQILYYGPIAVGTPLQHFKVIFDTASSEMWLVNPNCQGDCSIQKKYKHFRSSTYVSKGKRVTVKYVIGEIYGYTSQDLVTLGGDLSVPKQTFIEVTKSANLPDVFTYDGLLGLAFSALSFSNTTPVFHNLVRLGLTNPIFGVYLTDKIKGSEIMFGGVDPKRYKGELTYTNLTGSFYWQFKLDIKIRGKSFCKGLCDATVDTGDSLMTGKAAMPINKRLGAYAYEDGLYRFDCNNLSALPPVVFNIGGVNFTMTHEQYVVKIYRTCYSGFRYYPLGERINLGDPFLRAFYSAHDIKLKRIGFAPALQ